MYGNSALMLTAHREAHKRMRWGRRFGPMEVTRTSVLLRRGGDAEGV